MKSQWTDEELRKGKHRFWCEIQRDRTTDARMCHFLHLSEKGPWLSDLRQSYWLSHREMGRRMDISENAFAKFEKREKSGAISLLSLRRCAAAFGCEFIYGFKQKDGKLPEDTLWDQIMENMERHPWLFLWAQARDRVLNPNFRRLQGWVRDPPHFWRH